MQGLWCKHDRIDHHNGTKKSWISSRQLQRDVTSHAMSDDSRFYGCKFGTEPREVIGEGSHGVILMRGIALAVPAKVHRNDSKRPAEE